MLKRVVCGILAILMVFCTCSCGDSVEESSQSEEASESTQPTDESAVKEKKLTYKGIHNYLSINISYSTRIDTIYAPEESTYDRSGYILTEKIEIYPIKSGTFNNVKLKLLFDEKAGWFLRGEPTNCKQYFPRSDYMGVTCVDISLPADGKYEREYEYYSDGNWLSENNDFEYGRSEWLETRDIYEYTGIEAKKCVSGTFLPTN